MPSDQQRQNGTIITGTVLTALAGIFVVIRLIIRCLVIRKPGWDDLAIVASLLGVIAYVVEMYGAKANHIGFPMETLSTGNMTTLLKITLAIELTYYFCVFAVKVSILFMYLRFAVSTWFRRSAIFTMAFLAIFFLVCVIVTANQCNPIRKAWDITGTVEGHCINTTAFFYATSSVNIVTDFWILGMPIASLSRINRPNRERYALMAVFGVGLFAAITSIIRLKSIKEYTQAADPFRSALSVNLWSLIEINVAIICASVPALKPLFTPSRLASAVRGSKSGGSSSPNSGSLRPNGSGHGSSHGRPGMGSREVFHSDLEKLYTPASPTEVHHFGV